MNRQFTPKFGPVINKFGCNFLSILKMCEIWRGKEILDDEVLTIYKAALSTGIVTKEVFDKEGHALDGCLVKDATALITLTGAKGKLIPHPSGAKTWPLKDPLTGNTFIQEWYNPDTKFTHFVLGSSGKKLPPEIIGHGGIPVEWDPLRVSVTVKNGYLQGFRNYSFSS